VLLRIVIVVQDSVLGEEGIHSNKYQDVKIVSGRASVRMRSSQSSSGQTMHLCLRAGFLALVVAAGGVLTAGCGGASATKNPTETPAAHADDVNGSTKPGDQGHYQRKERKERVVVFVHGIYGSAMTTWKSPDGKTSWPELMASDNTFKNSDIYVVDYPSPKIGNMMTVDQEVSNIMNRLKDARVFEDHDEVVFLVHSLGGLITQRLLLTHRELVPKVKYIYFFSTPEEGAQIAQIGHLFNDDPLLKQMFHGDDNTFLEGIETDWINAGFDMPRYCAFERQKTKGILVVGRLSATRLCNRPAVALYADHSTIVEPADTNDGSYVAFRNAYRDNPPMRVEFENRDWKQSQNVDCNRTNSNDKLVASVSLDPAKRERVDGTVSVRLADQNNVKDEHVRLVSQTGNTATIDYGFNGLDRNWVGDCPGGGHATVVATFRIRKETPVE
jgi:pimeloyl-ACP methyl ester carboxylesterase